MGRIPTDRLVLRTTLESNVVDDETDDLDQVHILKCLIFALDLKFREIEDLLNHALESLRFAADSLEIFIFRASSFLLCQRKGDLDSGERGTNLVRHVAKQLLLGPDHLLDASRHPVELVGNGPELVIRLEIGPGAEITPGQRAGRRLKAQQPPAKGSCERQTGHRRREHGRQQHQPLDAWEPESAQGRLRCRPDNERVPGSIRSRDSLSVCSPIGCGGALGPPHRLLGRPQEPGKFAPKNVHAVVFEHVKRHAWGKIVVIGQPFGEPFDPVRTKNRSPRIDHVERRDRIQFFIPLLADTCV